MLHVLHRLFDKPDVGAAGVEYAIVIGLATLAIVAGTIGLSTVVESHYQTVTVAVDQAN
jgi:Flp pilus assembly pilin Flp